ncbi:putative Phage tail protein [Hyphomicrobium sp. 1Nfss2.1]
MRADCADAFMKAQPYHRELQSIYRYMMPWRQTTIDRAPGGGGQSEGASIADYIFDATGISAAANFAGTIQEDWMPMNREFFKLEAGPFLPEETDRDEINLAYSKITQRVHAISARPQLTALECFYDYFAGTCAMYTAKGNARTIINAAAAPIIELAIEDGPWGETWDIYWKRAYRFRDLPALWPNGKFSDAIKRAIEQTPREMLQVTQYTHYDPRTDSWLFDVWTDRDEDLDKVVWHEDFNVSPWSVARMFKMPGERFGRGLGHLALPFVKTANRGRELVLKAAVFAILGIWLRRNDSVFNPDTAVFDPGAMWAVSQTGGQFASLSRLPVPSAEFNISHIIQQEERDQIRRVLLDDELPDEQDPVRSATEVAGKLRRWARRKGGTGARLGPEFVVPYVQRACDILGQFGHVPKGITIDQIITRCLITAPAAAAQRSDKVEAWVNYTQIISMLFGPQVAMMLTKAEAIPEMGRNLGIPEEHLPKKADLDQMRQALQSAAQQMIANQKNGAGGPEQSSVAQQYLSEAAA